MKRLAAAAVLLALVGLVSPARAAEDPTGAWKFTAMLGKKSVEATLKLKVDGDKLTGTMGTEGGKGEAAIGASNVGFRLVLPAAKQTGQSNSSSSPR